MQWIDHHRLRDKHAFLSPSSAHWLRYDEAKLLNVFLNDQKKKEGTRKHAFASEAIKLKTKLLDVGNELDMFVNDSIDMEMESERILYYSDFCFGTADAIKFEDDQLFIFDLKTGTHKAKFEQLDVYAALFCLEYNVNPKTIYIEERIYQSGDITISNPDYKYIKAIMKTIIKHTNKLNEITNNGYYSD